MSKFARFLTRRDNQDGIVALNARKLQRILDSPSCSSPIRHPRSKLGAIAEPSSDSDELMPHEYNDRPCVLAASGRGLSNEWEEDSSTESLSSSPDDLVVPKSSVTNELVSEIMLKDWGDIIASHDRFVANVNQGDPVHPIESDEFCRIFSFVCDM